jgi:Putative GTPase activating protein for Arf
MLAKPGSSRAAGSRAYSSNRRKQQEDPTDQLRKISKNTPNKKCADCGAKLPQCINLSVGSFICMSCAGICREVNLKVKSLGHSTFTEYEVEMMRQTDNDKVNELWLAQYNPQSERMKPPNGNVDQNHLRTWIKRKYQDKQWYGGSGDGGGGGRSQQQQQSSRGGGGGGSGRQQSQPQPTMVQIPPAQQPAPAQEVDLFANFDAPTPAPAPVPSNNNSSNQPADEEWASFGGSSSKPKNNNDPFGGDPFASASAPAPPQQQPAASNNQNNNFANFGQASQQQQMPNDPFAQTPVATAPAPPQQQQQQQQNFGNFQAQFPAQQQNLQQSQFPTSQPNVNNNAFGGDPFATAPAAGGGSGGLQQQQQQPQGFANFQEIPQQQIQQPSQQPQMVTQNQQGFANFGGTQQNNQRSMQQSQMMPQQQLQPGGMQQGFANFDGATQNQQSMQQSQMMPPPQQQQMQQPQQPSMQQGFGNFTNAQAPQQQQQQQQQMAPQQTNQDFGGNMNINNNTDANKASSSDDPFADVPLATSAALPVSVMSTMDKGHQQQQQQQQPAAMPTAPPAGDASVASGGPSSNDPMNAFGHLSVSGPYVSSGGFGGMEQSSGFVAAAAPVSAPVVPHAPKFKAKDVVCYKTNGSRMKAQIVKVHLDDELDPFYTIALPFGKEKQTDDGHLELIDPLFEKLESKLLAMSSADLKQIEDFIATMVPKAATHTLESVPAIDTAAVPTAPVALTKSTFAAAPVSGPAEINVATETVPQSVAPPSPSGMSHVSQLTQPTAAAAQTQLMPTLSSNNMSTVPVLQQQQQSMMGNMNTTTGMGTMNGFGAGPDSTNLKTIPSPMPADKAPAPSNISGQVPTPPMTASVSSQQNSMGMSPPSQPNRNMGMQTQPQNMQQQGMSNPGTSQQPTPQMNGNMGMQSGMGSLPSPNLIPSPAGKSPAGPNQMTQQNMSQMQGQIGAPPLTGEQQQQPQQFPGNGSHSGTNQMIPPQQQQQQVPQQMMTMPQGQMGGQTGAGAQQMMMPQHSQQQAPQQMMMPQGQVGGQMMMPQQQQYQQQLQQQMMMPQGQFNGQPASGAPQIMMMAPQQQQPQGQMAQFQQTNTAGQEQGGNPFDMY